jgi:hypothetical protein
MRKTLLFLMGVMIIVVFAIPASGKLYKYIDNRGIVRYADDLETVPERYRSQITPPPPAEPERPAVTPQAPETTAKKPVPAPGPIIAAPEKPTQASASTTVVEKPGIKPPADVRTPEKAAAVAPAPGPMIVTESAAPSPAPEPEAAPGKPALVTEPETAGKPAFIPEPEIAAKTSAPEPQLKIDVEKPVIKETVITDPPITTARVAPDLTPAPPVDSDISALLDRQSQLLEKKKALDKTFLSLQTEKQALMASRDQMRDAQSIQQYNKNVSQLNEKIQRFKTEETALRNEIVRYNTLIGQKQQP